MRHSVIVWMSVLEKEARCTARIRPLVKYVSIFMKINLAPQKSFLLLRDTLYSLQQPAFHLRVFPHAFRKVADKAEDGIFNYFISCSLHTNNFLGF